MVLPQSPRRPSGPFRVRHVLAAGALLLLIPAASAQAPDAPGTGTPAPVVASPTSTAPAAPATPLAEAPAPASPAQAVAPGAGLATTPTPSLLPHDLSPWGMFMNADIVVKGVMVGLAFASLVTWTVWLAKTLHLTGARLRAVRGVRDLLRADSLDALSDRAGPTVKSRPVAALVHAALHERQRSGSLPAAGIKERAAIALGRVEARAARGMTRGTGVVATIGSTAPFVGLFGTVWGIMNSFVGISQAHTTNLAVVAPGIAEALLATAIGLVAAIPAVIIYNTFARGIAAYKALLSDASAEVMRHLSRDLDRRVQAAG